MHKNLILVESFDSCYSMVILISKSLLADYVIRIQVHYRYELSSSTTEDDFISPKE